MVDKIYKPLLAGNPPGVQAEYVPWSVAWVHRGQRQREYPHPFVQHQ
jgi:hypothetical protein